MKERWKINVNAIYASHDFIAGELVLFPWLFRLFQPRQTHIIQTWRRARIVQLSDLADMLDYFEITIKTCVWDFYNIIIPVLITRSISLTILSLSPSLSFSPPLSHCRSKKNSLYLCCSVVIKCVQPAQYVVTRSFLHKFHDYNSFHCMNVSRFNFWRKKNTSISW